MRVAPYVPRWIVGLGILQTTVRGRHAVVRLIIAGVAQTLSLPALFRLAASRRSVHSATALARAGLGVLRDRRRAVQRLRRSRYVLLVAVLCSAPAARAGEPGYVLPRPDAPIFSVAGGGIAAPQIGRVATDVRLHPREAVFLPDGRIVIRDARFNNGTHGQLVVVAPDGRIAAAPPFPPRPIVKDPLGNPVPIAVDDIDVERDGGLLALVTGEPRVLRLGLAGWTPVHTPAGVLSIAALPDGGILALTDGVAWWLTHEGVVVARRALPDGVNGSDEFTESVTPLPDGGFVAGSIGGATYAVLGRPGRPFQRLPRLGGDDVGFDDLPDGSILAARGPVIRLPAAADTRAPLYGARPALGPGDGGPARQALLASAGVITGPTGAVLVTEPNGLRHDLPPTVDGVRDRGRIVTDVYGLDETVSAGSLRWIGTPPPGRLLAAIAPTVYQRLASGHIPVVTSIGGDARVVVRSGRHVVGVRHAAIAAGTDDVALGRRLSPGEYRIEMTVTNASQIAMYRLGVSTRRVLPLRQAIAAIRRAIQTDGDGDGGSGLYFDATGCRRGSARRVSCTYLAVSYEPDRSTTRCAGTVSAYLRGDGIRIVRDRTRWHRCSHAR